MALAQSPAGPLNRAPVGGDGVSYMVNVQMERRALVMALPGRELYHHPAEAIFLTSLLHALSHAIGLRLVRVLDHCKEELPCGSFRLPSPSPRLPPLAGVCERLAWWPRPRRGPGSTTACAVTVWMPVSPACWIPP
ncbi:MAG: hypothetical protein NVSMB32_03000 [Actinomycetota bacterium]